MGVSFVVGGVVVLSSTDGRVALVLVDVGLVFVVVFECDICSGIVVDEVDMVLVVISSVMI